MTDILIHQNIPVIANVDILVAGAGSAGCCAAIAARRFSKPSVMLIERYGFAGGASTGVLDTFYGFFTPGNQPRKVVGGIPDEVVDALAIDHSMYLRPNTYGRSTGVTYNPQRLKLVWDQLLSAAAVKVRFHTTLVDVETAANGYVVSAIVHGKEGFGRIKASRFIDASGDADLCHLAGVPYENADDLALSQTLTTTFQVAGVDCTRFLAAGGKELLKHRIDDMINGQLAALPRRCNTMHSMATDGCMTAVAIRIAELDGLLSDDLTRAEIEGRRQAYVYEAFLRDCVIGFENARIINLSTQIGVRETRRVYGQHRLSKEDCLSLKRFDDVVLLCAAPLESNSDNDTSLEQPALQHIPGDHAYDVPYGTLVPQNRNEIWVAGRCFSATHDAHASCRFMGQTMSMGQAVGVAAGLSLEQGVGAPEVPIAELQNRLRRLGAVLEEPQEVAESAARAWEVNRLQKNNSLDAAN